MDIEATAKGASSDRDRLRNAIKNQMSPEPPVSEPETEQQNEIPVEQEAIKEEATNEAVDAEVVEVTETEATDETQNAQEAEVTETQYQLSDIASLFGVDENKFDVNEDGQLLVKAKIDGEESAVNFNDLVKSYQLEGHLNKQNMEVVEAKKQLANEKETWSQEAQAKSQLLEDSLTLASNMLTGEFNSVDWQALERESPTDFMLTRQRYADRQAQLQQAYQALEQHRNEQRVNQLEQGKKNLFDAIPEWKDQESYQKGKKELMEGLVSYGFNTNEIKAVMEQGQDISGLDHRVYLMARDAVKYRQLMAKKPEVEKKVSAAPKIVKGAGKPQVKVSEADKIRNEIKKTGGKRGSLVQYLKAKRN